MITDKTLQIKLSNHPSEIKSILEHILQYHINAQFLYTPRNYKSNYCIINLQQSLITNAVNISITISKEVCSTNSIQETCDIIDAKFETLKTNCIIQQLIKRIIFKRHEYNIPFKFIHYQEIVYFKTLNQIQKLVSLTLTLH